MPNPSEILQQLILRGQGEAPTSPVTPPFVPNQEEARPSTNTDLILGGPEAIFQRELDKYLGKGQSKKTSIIKKILAGVAEVGSAATGHQTPVERMRAEARDTWKTQVPALSRENVATTNAEARRAESERKYSQFLQNLALSDRRLAAEIERMRQKGEFDSEKWETQKEEILSRARNNNAKADQTETQTGFMKQFSGKLPSNALQESLFAGQSQENRNMLLDRSLINNIVPAMKAAQGTPGSTSSTTSSRTVSRTNQLLGTKEDIQIPSTSLRTTQGTPGNPMIQQTIQNRLGVSGNQGSSEQGPVNTQLIPGITPRKFDPPVAPESPKIVRPAVPFGTQSRPETKPERGFTIYQDWKAAKDVTKETTEMWKSNAAAWSTTSQMMATMQGFVARAQETGQNLETTMAGEGKIGGARHKGGKYAALEMLRGIRREDPLESNAVTTYGTALAEYIKSISGAAVSDAERDWLAKTKPNVTNLPATLMRQTLKAALFAQYRAWLDGAGPGGLLEQFPGLKKGQLDTEIMRKLRSPDALVLLDRRADQLMLKLGYNEKTLKFDKIPEIKKFDSNKDTNPLKIFSEWMYPYIQRMETAKESK